MLFSGKKEIQTYLEISATYKLIIHASRYALIYEFKVGSGYCHVTRYSVTYSAGEGSQAGGSGDCLLGGRMSESDIRPPNKILAESTSGCLLKLGLLLGDKVVESLKSPDSAVGIGAVDTSAIIKFLK